MIVSDEMPTLPEAADGITGEVDLGSLPAKQAQDEDGRQEGGQAEGRKEGPIAMRLAKSGQAEFYIGEMVAFDGEDAVLPVAIREDGGPEQCSFWYSLAAAERVYAELGEAIKLAKKAKEEI